MHLLSGQKGDAVAAGDALWSMSQRPAPLPAVLRRSFSDPSPKACQSAVPPHNSVDLQYLKSKRVKRMKDGMRVMRQWLDEVMREGEDEEEEEEGGDGGYEFDEKNGAPKALSSRQYLLLLSLFNLF